MLQRIGRRICLGLWIGWLCSYGLAQEFPKGLPLTQNFSYSDYRAATKNWKIVQTREGIIYIANHAGLLEYDGTYWDLHLLPGNQSLRSLAIDREGTIYCGGQREFGYFSLNAESQWTYHSLIEKIPAKYRSFSEIWKIYITESEIYFTCFEYVFVYKGGEIEVVVPPEQVRHAYFLNNTLYVPGLESGLYILENLQWKLIPNSEAIAGKFIQTIIPLDKNSHLLVTRTSEIYKFYFRDERVERWYPEADDFLAKSVINMGIRLKNGNLAIGTHNHGLVILSNTGKILANLDSQGGLNDDTVHDAYEDEQNNLWLAMGNGMAYVEMGTPFSIIDRKSGVSGSGYTAVNTDRGLFLGTSNGLFHYPSTKLSEQQSLWEDFLAFPGAYGQVWECSEIDGELLLAHDKGAFSVEESLLHPLTPELVAWDFHRLSTHPEVMIQGGYSGLNLYRRQPGGWKFIHKIKGFGEPARFITDDEHGNIWVANESPRLTRIRLNATQDQVEHIWQYEQEAGLPVSSWIKVFKVRGQLLFATQQGLYQYDPVADQFVPEDRIRKALGNLFVVEMEEDMFGNIYVITQEDGRARVGILRRDSFGEYTADFTPFQRINPLLIDVAENITYVSPQLVLIGGKEGFIQYNPSVPTQTPESLPLVLRKITSITQEDSTLYNGTPSLATHKYPLSFELPFSRNDLRFTFSTPFYSSLGQLQYRSQLKGFDQVWSPWSSKTEREYTNLPPGDYEFSLQVRGMGITEEVLVSKLTILPPWYRSRWAYVIYVLLTVSLFVLFGLLLDRRYSREREQIEREQQAALKAKEHEMEAMAQQSEAEIAQLKNEKLQAELTFKDQELTSSTMLILAKNEFLLGLKDQLGRLHRGDSNGEAPPVIKKLIKDIDQNIQSEKDWERFEHHFVSVHGDFFKRLKAKCPQLTPQELKLCAYLRLNMTTKEIAQLLNISIRGVETGRYRLRKKLGLQKEVHLVDYMMEF